MKKHQMKTLGLFLLIILTIIQTGELWFGSGAYNNWTIGILGTFGTTDIDRTIISVPGRIITGANDRFYISYSDIKNTTQMEAADKAIKKMLSQSVFIETKSIDYADVYGRDSITLDYGFAFPAEYYAQTFDMKTNVLSQRVKSFTSVVIIPGELDADKTRFIFLDEENGESHEFTSQTQLNAALSEAIRLKKASSSVSGGVYYVSSKMMEYDVSVKNIFIPISEITAIRLHKINEENPYTPNGETLIETIGKMVDLFFAASTQKSYDLINEIYTFHDEYSVVKYRPDGYLEYKSYRPSSNKGSNTFLTAYSAALAFIMKDISVDTEYRLVSYENKNSQWIFYLDYAVNDMPVFMKDRHAIEITVIDDVVTEYSKAVNNLYADEESYITAVVKFEERIQYQIERDETFSHNDINLGYYLSASDKTAVSSGNYELYWRIQLEGLPPSFAVAK